MKLVVIESPFAAPSAKDLCLCVYLPDGQGHLGVYHDKCERCWRITRELDKNRCYLSAAIADSLKRGEAPYASHRIYPGVLNDDVPEQRKLGMEAGFAWGTKADLVAVYADLGISDGMRAGIDQALERGQEIEERQIGWTK